MKTGVYYDCPICGTADAILCSINLDAPDRITLHSAIDCRKCGSWIKPTTYFIKSPDGRPVHVEVVKEADALMNRRELNRRAPSRSRPPNRPPPAPATPPCTSR